MSYAFNLIQSCIRNASNSSTYLLIFNVFLIKCITTQKVVCEAPLPPLNVLCQQVCLSVFLWCISIFKQLYKKFHIVYPQGPTFSRILHQIYYLGKYSLKQWDHNIDHFGHFVFYVQLELFWSTIPQMIFSRFSW